MSSLANILSIPASAVKCTVVDKTGLTGAYDFTFDWSIYSASAAAAPVDSPDAGSVPTVFTAVGELGLKLQPSTASVETLVIDHVERPTEKLATFPLDTCDKNRSVARKRRDRIHRIRIGPRAAQWRESSEIEPALL